MFRKYLAVACVVLACAAAGAQTYPNKPIRLIVPFPPGGNNDVIARVIASRMGERLGQSVIVENRGGASAIIGTEAVANANPDGYTILLASNAVLGVNAVAFSKLPYDPIKSFTPISLVANSPMIVAVGPNTKARTLADLAALAKSKPDELTYAATATSVQLPIELFASKAGIKMRPVQYKGSAPALIDLLAGRIDVMFDPPSTIFPFVKSGKVTALAVTTARRSALAPEIPSIAEQGYPDYDIGLWHCFLVPAGTPAAVVKKLNEAVIEAVASSAVHEQFDRLGIEPVSSSQAELAERIHDEIARWQKVAKDIGLQPQ